MSDYKPQTIEKKWQERWRRERSFEVTENDPRPKFYCLEMFAYPSGHAHVGHVRNYMIGDVVARMKRMRGFNVLHPFGWDAFGLPAENAAIKGGMHPEKWTLENIAHMKGQLQRIGISYAWEREIATCLPDYYHWNQWLFLKMLERDLAFRKRSNVNWCPSCQTVLANEQVVDGGLLALRHACEIRELEQWFFRITHYADELLEAADRLTGWPEKVLTMQRNWIGRSEGARVSFALAPDDGRGSGSGARGSIPEPRAASREQPDPEPRVPSPESRGDRRLHHPHRHHLRRQLPDARAGAPARAAVEHERRSGRRRSSKRSSDSSRKTEPRGCRARSKKKASTQDARPSIPSRDARCRSGSPTSSSASTAPAQ